MSNLTAKKCREIVKFGVDPGEIDSIDLAEAKGFLECHKLAEEILVKALNDICSLDYPDPKIREAQTIFILDDAFSNWRKANEE